MKNVMCSASGCIAGKICTPEELARDELDFRLKRLEMYS